MISLPDPSRVSVPTVEKLDELPRAIAPIGTPSCVKAMLPERIHPIVEEGA
jgi:hypothetical protein